MSSPEDPQERLADEVADSVLRAPEPSPATSAPPPIQRKCAACADEEKETIQAKRASPGAGAALDTGAAVRAAERGGEPLSQAARYFFEPRFGRDLSHVRVHTGAEATQAARGVRARAFTLGQHIVFNRGEYAPEAAEGRRLLAHELTHVVQQGWAGPATIFRAPDPEPHYPSESEQRRIEHHLGRDLEAPTPPPQAGGAPPPAAERGRSLGPDERLALVERLEKPLFAAIGLGLGPDEQMKTTVKDNAAAFDLATRAKEAIYEKYGRYLDRKLALTQTDTSAADRIKADQVLVQFGASERDATSLARTLIDTHCGECQSALSDLDDDSRKAVVSALLGRVNADRERAAQLKKVAQARVGGSYSHAQRSLRIAQFTPDPYGTAVHELIHALTHPAFRAAFIDERNIIEGFTEYFTRQVAGGSRDSYQEAFSKVEEARDAMTGPYLFAVDGASAEESLRLAYFRGRLDLIGWKPSGPAEAKAVEDAGGAAQWDPDKARVHDAAFQQRVRDAQDPHRNVLGVGYFFQDEGGHTISVRYARVLSRSEPLARRQIYLEGQVFGDPISDPRRLGGSIGLGIEYQEPHFYAGGGLRLVGSGALSGARDDRVDISPFAGLGVRAWQRVRVGAEGFVLFPLTGQSIVPGIGGNVAVEF